MSRPKPFKIRLASKVSDEAMKDRRGTGISESDMGIQIHTDADVYLPSGQLLCALRRNVITKPVRDRAVAQFKWMKTKFTTDNRGSYTGYETVGNGDLTKAPTEGRTRLVRKDGRMSRQTRTLNNDGKVVNISSAIIGFYDRSGRFPFCRKSAFTQNFPERWAEVVPLVKEVSDFFATELPERHAVQKAFVAQQRPEYTIPGTVFSTLTVNNNVCGTVHKDAGDFKDGMGVIGCFREGDFVGGELCFPQYKVFVDFTDGDILFFNPHEWHGVNPMEHVEPENEGTRITVVYYYRRKLCECGSVEQEISRARERFGGLDTPEGDTGEDNAEEA
jgi:hypothetical protein